MCKYYKESTKKFDEAFEDIIKMNSIDDVIHFFEMEIECTKSKSEEMNDCFNGVQVGFAEAKNLQERHIKYCQKIIDRIRSGRL